MILYLVLVLAQNGVAQGSNGLFFASLDERAFNLRSDERARLASLTDKQFLQEGYQLVAVDRSLMGKDFIVDLPNKDPIAMGLVGKHTDILGNTAYHYRSEKSDYAIVVENGPLVRAFFQVGAQIVNIDPLSERCQVLTIVDNMKSQRMVRPDETAAMSAIVAPGKSALRTPGNVLNRVTACANLT